MKGQAMVKEIERRQINLIDGTVDKAEGNAQPLLRPIKSRFDAERRILL